MDVEDDLRESNGPTPEPENTPTPVTMQALVSPNVKSSGTIDKDTEEQEFTKEVIMSDQETNQKKLQEDDIVIQSQEVAEDEANEDVEDSEDYYADDKFVYEDIAEDQSSEDPE